MNFQFDARSEIGSIRNQNEDYYLIGDGFWNDSQGYLFVVCDGLSFFHDEDINLAASTIISEFYTDNTIDRPKALKRSFELADKKLFSQNNEQGGYGGTTAVAALLHENQLHIAYVGNSKAFLLQNNSLQIITHNLRDKLLELLVEEGHLNETEVENNRFWIGVRPPLLGIRDEVKVNISTHSLQTGDVILLCTDGLSEFLDETEIFHILKASSISNICEDLFVQLEKKKPVDNATALVIKVTQI